VDATNDTSRRDFLQTCAVLGGTILPARLLAGDAPPPDSSLLIPPGCATGLDAVR